MASKKDIKSISIPKDAIVKGPNKTIMVSQLPYDCAG